MLGEYVDESQSESADDVVNDIAAWINDSEAKIQGVAAPPWTWISIRSSFTRRANSLKTMDWAGINQGMSILYVRSWGAICEEGEGKAE